MLKISAVVCLLPTSECPDEATKSVLDKVKCSQVQFIRICNLKVLNRGKVTLITR